MRQELVNYLEIELELKELGNTFQVQFKKIIDQGTEKESRDISTPEVTPEVTPEATPEVTTEATAEVTTEDTAEDTLEAKLLLIMSEEMSRQEISEKLNLKQSGTFT